jgi:hypothetical protein
MSNSTRRTRGFATERLVADYLKQWWGSATVGRGADPRGDVINVPFDVEIKATAKFSYLQWVKQQSARTAKSGKLGFIVWRCNGQATKVHEYAALVPLEVLIDLLLKAGYGEMPHDVRELDPIRCKMCGGWSFKETCKMCESDPDANL